MKTKAWFVQIPVILAFTICFLILELGWRGELRSPLLREKVYPALSRASHVLTDYKFKLRGEEAPKNKIVIVEIDSAALETLGRWPWHRDVMSYLVEKTFLAGAKVVGLDIVYSEPDPRVPKDLVTILKEKNLSDLSEKFETDRILQDVIQRYSDRLVLAWTTEQSCQPAFDEAASCPVKEPLLKNFYPETYEKFSFQEFHSAADFDPARVPIVSFLTPITNIPEYNAAAKHLGFLNAFLDSDGYIRKTSLAVLANGKPYPSLALEMARAGMGERLELSLDSNYKVQKLGFSQSGLSFPVSPLGALQINFRGPGRLFQHVSALDLMSEKETLDDPLNQKLTGKSKAEIFKDAYVLIGVSAIGVFDMRQFPFEANAPGVEGHANILDNLLSGDPMQHNSGPWGTPVILILMVVGAAFLAFFLGQFNALQAIAFFAGVIASLAYIDVFVLFKRHQNWNTVYFYFEMIFVFLIAFAAKYLQEEKDKKFIRGAFSKYVSPLIVDSILKDPSKLSLGGEKRDMTILFSDIRSFTSFSETMDAKALASFLNDYLGIMTKIVFAHRGTLDKYIGDAVMAFWGAPLEDPDHAYHACCAAREMAKALAENRERFKQQYGIDVHAGIGINSGVVNVGNMGSDVNFEYTVIGDQVNLASRVEGITKEYGVEILITRFTYDRAMKAAAISSNPNLLPHRILDDVKVKGKKNAVELIQLFPSDPNQEAVQLFAQGRELYRAKRWDEAIAKLGAANALFAQVQGTLIANPGDGPCSTFIERCRAFQVSPPPEGWDGSWKMETK